MPAMKLDAVTVTSADMIRSAEFYRLLGFNFPVFAPDVHHLEPLAEPDDVRLMIDDRDLMQSITGKPPVPPNHSSFAMKCASPVEVDNATEAIEAAGFSVIRQPWDAFWGQRYAIVADPDGYMIDLFAPLES